MLWLAWLSGNMTMWMHEVNAAWRMTELTDDPALVAWVQAVGTLPMFVLGLASGAWADLYERRRFLALAQAWIAVVAAALALLAGLDGLTPSTLLALCALNGVGLALRFPVFAALVPDLVPREQLSSALALNAVAINLTRVIGPVVAGALLSLSGTAVVFAVNALLSVLACALILHTPVASHLSAERDRIRTPLLAAIAQGLSHIRQSPRLRAILLRAFVFFGHAVALIALLPLLAKRLGPGAHHYAVLLSAMGVGAVMAAIVMQRLSSRHGNQRIVDVCVWLHALSIAGAVWAPNLPIMALASALAGGVWMVVANTMTMSAQLALPPTLRARGMAIYQMSIMGGCAFGAAQWGLIAQRGSVSTSLLISAGMALLLLLWTRRHDIEAPA